ncbi:MAG TPA: HEAT repeat domain-containing protein [Longimicrobiaceae bacterium]|nr:HEAT repeat domain-containing protein [Longimicrobiaceae bacterium]
MTHSPASEPDISDLDPRPVEEVLRALAAALRGYRLYEGNSPMLDRFVSMLRQKMASLWDELSALRLAIEEDRILWEDREVFPGGETGSDLAFLFYKDGVREVTILPGFEEEEVLSLLRVLARAPAIREEDDLVTLLWQEEFAHFRYRTVEATDEGAELHTPSADDQPLTVDPAAVREEERENLGLSTEDFEEALYFLDEAELRRLREEIRLETERDLWRDVLNALLDRLEDGDAERQQRILAILAELLPSALASGQFERSAALLEDLIEVARRPGTLTPPALREVRTLFDLLGQEETVIQLADILEELPHRISEDAVLRLLGYFPPGSIAALMRAAERVEQSAVRRAFEVCIQRLAEDNRDEVVALLKSEDPAVLTGALRWVGRLEIGSALNDLVRFLKHDSAEVRLAAIEGIVSIRAAAAATALLPLLNDSQREVRMAAARGLGTLSFTAARAPLEAALTSKRLKEADRVEKLAFFEAYGRLAGPEGVAILEKILSARSWLGRGESPETRACAALALAKIRHPSARNALQAVENDSDPVVRTAGARALRGETG